MTNNRNKSATVFLITINSILSLYFLILSLFSLNWRMVHDSRILFYIGYLIDKFGAIPYKDIFDMNMPGSYWINALSGCVFGFTDRGFQKSNLLILLTTVLLIYFWLRSFNQISAWTGSLFFGIFFCILYSLPNIFIQLISCKDFSY